MKRILSVILIAALLITAAALFTGCGEEEDKNYPVTVNGVTLDKEPVNIIAADACLADIISYMGYDRKMVARSDECDQEFLNVFPSIGRADGITSDAVKNAGADLVIADSTLSPAVVNELRTNGITVVTFERAHDLASLKEQYIQLGTLLGGNTSGSKKGEDSYNTLLSSLSQYKSIPTGVVKTSAYLYLNESGELCTFTKGSFEQKIFDYNGSMNTLSHQEKPQVDLSQLRIGSPGTIFYADDAVLNYLSADETLSRLSALVTSKLCRIPLKNFSRYGTSCEQIIYDMASYLKDKPATPDEATPDEQPEISADGEGDYGDDADSYDESWGD